MRRSSNEQAYEIRFYDNRTDARHGVHFRVAYLNRIGFYSGWKNVQSGYYLAGR